MLGGDGDDGGVIEVADSGHFGADLLPDGSDGGDLLAYEPLEVRQPQREPHGLAHERRTRVLYRRG